MDPITSLRFDNTYARLAPELYDVVDPTPLVAPRVLALNPDAAGLIGLDLEASSRDDLAQYLSGARRIPGAEPIAMLYAGHQFGVWVPQLGDGRAILLAQTVNDRGDRWDLQLKGGGPTRYSRGGDGRAVLRSTIREYLASEAMHGLGIPTTRALSIVTSDTTVRREAIEPAATLIRLAPSHVRFGTFEVLTSRDRPDLLRALTNHVIELHAPAFKGRIAEWFRDVVIRTARLMASWQAVGFTHGVMNTDNMSILGLTLDYGPYGFMEAFDQAFTPNHSDHAGRYAFDQQPGVGLWNVVRLAEALVPLINQEEAQEAVDAYRPAFEQHLGLRLRAKLGFSESRPEDTNLIRDLFDLLQAQRADYTRFFRALALFSSQDGSAPLALREEVTDQAALDAWVGRYRDRLAAERSRDGERQARMARVNPVYVLRAWLAEQAIRRAEDDGDGGEIERLRLLLRYPYAEQPNSTEYTRSAPEWARDLVLSCSS